MFSVEFCNNILNHVLGPGTYDAPSTLYLGLSRTMPRRDGRNLDEPTDKASYARVAVAETIWSESTDALKVNSTKISFPTATEEWGMVVSWFLADAAVDGNLIVMGRLSVPDLIEQGETFCFEVGNLQIGMG